MNHSMLIRLFAALALLLLATGPLGCVVAPPPGGPGPGGPGGPPGGGFTHEPNVDRPGMNYKNFPMNTADPGLCEQACANDPNCQAFTYVHPGIQGPKARCWLKHGVPPAKTSGCCVSGVRGGGPPPGGPGPGGPGPGGPGPGGPQVKLTVEPNIDRPGMNYTSFDLKKPKPKRCRKACAKDPKCKAYTYVKPGIQGPKARCWLKYGVPPPKNDPCCVSGVK